MFCERWQGSYAKAETGTVRRQVPVVTDLVQTVARPQTARPALTPATVCHKFPSMSREERRYSVISINCDAALPISGSGPLWCVCHYFAMIKATDASIRLIKVAKSPAATLSGARLTTYSAIKGMT